MNLQEYYDSIAQEKNLWQESRKSNFYYKEIIRYQGILKLIPSGIKNVLDLGCGDGYLSYLIAKKGFVVTSLDISPKRLEKFKDIAEKYHIEQKIGDVTNTGLVSQSFDLIVCSEVLEHIENYKDVLKEAHRLLAPGGRFILSVPNRENLKIITCPYCLKPFYRDGHVNRFDENGLSKDLIETGFEVENSQVLRSRILNQFQYHLHLPYGSALRLIDRIFCWFFKNYTLYLVIKARKVT
ncbi:hypothetical protein DRQ15_10395 [candidate division KSB1 bacterium]|nr:MAG: hypothetical protein DRQ15_10395 [candidate division KSB1 bacterium]